MAGDQRAGGDATQAGGADRPRALSERGHDLRRIVAERGWTAQQVTALRNTCAAATAKETMPARDREMAAAIAAALDGRGPGLTDAHLAFLAQVMGWESEGSP